MLERIKIVRDTSVADRLLAQALGGGCLKNRQFLKSRGKPYWLMA